MFNAAVMSEIFVGGFDKDLLSSSDVAGSRLDSNFSKNNFKTSGSFVLWPATSARFRSLSRNAKGCSKALFVQPEKCVMGSSIPSQVLSLSLQPCQRFLVHPL